MLIDHRKLVRLLDDNDVKTVARWFYMMACIVAFEGFSSSGFVPRSNLVRVMPCRQSRTRAVRELTDAGLVTETEKGITVTHFDSLVRHADVLTEDSDEKRVTRSGHDRDAGGTRSGHDRNTVVTRPPANSLKSRNKSLSQRREEKNTPTECDSLSLKNTLSHPDADGVVADAPPVAPGDTTPPPAPESTVQASTPPAATQTVSDAPVASVTHADTSEPPAARQESASEPVAPVAAPRLLSADDWRQQAEARKLQQQATERARTLETDLRATETLMRRKRLMATSDLRAHRAVELYGENFENAPPGFNMRNVALPDDAEFEAGVQARLAQIREAHANINTQQAQAA